MRRSNSKSKSTATATRYMVALAAAVALACSLIVAATTHGAYRWVWTANTAATAASASQCRAKKALMENRTLKVYRTHAVWIGKHRKRRDYFACDKRAGRHHRLGSEVLDDRSSDPPSACLDGSSCPSSYHQVWPVALGGTRYVFWNRTKIDVVGLEGGGHSRIFRTDMRSGKARRVGRDERVHPRFWANGKLASASDTGALTYYSPRYRHVRFISPLGRERTLAVYRQGPVDYWDDDALFVVAAPAITSMKLVRHGRRYEVHWRANGVPKRVERAARKVPRRLCGQPVSDKFVKMRDPDGGLLRLSRPRRWAYCLDGVTAGFAELPAQCEFEQEGKTHVRSPDQALLSRSRDLLVYACNDYHLDEGDNTVYVGDTVYVVDARTNALQGNWQTTREGCRLLNLAADGKVSCAER